MSNGRVGQVDVERNVQVNQNDASGRDEIDVVVLERVTRLN